MKKGCLLALLLSFLAAPVLAGEIWGIVRLNGVPQEGLSVNVSCNGQKLEPARTDRYGLYNVFTDMIGECQLEVVRYSYLSSSVIHRRTISSYARPVRCDVHLIP
jgi:hypothetical protein